MVVKELRSSLDSLMPCAVRAMLKGDDAQKHLSKLLTLQGASSIHNAGFDH
jgi:hypothetical protein